MAQEGSGVKRGLILGKFMPPHAGHVSMIESARALVDELTILLCSQPDDPISGELRRDWMAALFPNCRLVWHADPAPQHPNDSADFWAIWRDIVTSAHPEPIDYVFAGEAYGAELARQVGGLFVPLGARILEADRNGIGGLSARAVRENPWRHWRHLPDVVRSYYTITICLHGIESVGKSTLAERLAAHYGTIVVPEYGRSHCETHGTQCREADLLLIGDAQQAMIEAARPWSSGLMIADTDSLMTAAWSQMMIGYTPDQLICHRKADLYLMLGSDAPFIDDGTRVYKAAEQRAKFDRIARGVLKVARVEMVDIQGSWDERFDLARSAIDTVLADKGFAVAYGSNGSSA